MKKSLPVLIFILIFFFIARYFIADTGLFFAYDYLKNKLDINNTLNQVSINNIDKQTEDYDYLFNDIKGFKNKLNNFNSIKINKDQLIESDEWIRSNGGNFSNKYSDLDLINLTNIKDLKLDFKINMDNNFIKKKWMNNVETNPIFFDGILFAITPFKEIIAIDIESKNVLWKFKSLKKINSRGMTLWINKQEKSKSCIFLPIRNGLFCINYKTGKLNKAIGLGGFIKTGIVKAAPVIWKNYVVVATVDDQKVKCFDLKNGNLVFEINIHPLNRNFKGGSPWGGISVDTKNNLLFLTTGNPRPALLGSSRKGPNKNANSIVAINLEKQKIVWTFQEVSHDLWDYDIASPTLTSFYENEFSY